MANEKRLIDANEAIEKINCLCVDGNENWIGTDNQSFVDHADVIDILSDMPTVDAVEVAALKMWLYEIAMNNSDNYLGDACEVLIARLDGLREFARERRTEC